MASLLHLFKKDPDGILKSINLRIPTKATGQAAMGNSGQVPFDLVQNGEYGDFVPAQGSSNICAWTEYPTNVASASLAEPAAFALTAPLTGCTTGALKTGTWFHTAHEADAGVIQKQLQVSLAAARMDSLNFIFGPAEYDSVSKTYAPGGGVQIIVFGMKMPDTKWTFWGQWQKRPSSGGDNATRLTWKQIGRYPNA